jgi:hypothetical protein
VKKNIGRHPMVSKKRWSKTGPRKWPAANGRMYRPTCPAAMPKTAVRTSEDYFKAAESPGDTKSRDRQRMEPLQGSRSSLAGMSVTTTLLIGRDAPMIKPRR